MGVQIVKNAQNCNVTSCKVLENISNNCPVSDPRRKHIGTVKVSISDSNIHDIFSLCSYRSFHLYCSLRKIGWLVVLMIYIVLAIFQPYRDLEAGDNQSLNHRGETVNGTPDLLLRKPRA